MRRDFKEAHASVPVLVPLDALKFSTEVFSMPSDCSEDTSQGVMLIGNPIR